MGTDLDRMAAYTSEFARQMREIAADLWNSDGPEAGKQPENEKKPAEMRPAEKKASDPKRKAGKETELPTFEQLWKASDETIEWTVVMTHEHPTDGLTSQTQWDYLKQHAEGVLNGDVKEYVEVLEHMNPLGDLTIFASGIQIRACSADRLEVSFQCMPSALGGSEQLRQRYVCGMCLRIARDLMALLPVTEVAVEALRMDGPEQKVTYKREQLRRKNFSFTDPVAFTQMCAETD